MASTSAVGGSRAASTNDVSIGAKIVEWSRTLISSETYPKDRPAPKRAAMGLQRDPAAHLLARRQQGDARRQREHASDADADGGVAELDPTIPKRVEFLPLTVGERVAALGSRRGGHPPHRAGVLRLKLEHTRQCAEKPQAQARQHRSRGGLGPPAPRCWCHGARLLIHMYRLALGRAR